jgi:hypothetical protein
VELDTDQRAKLKKMLDRSRKIAPDETSPLSTDKGKAAVTAPAVQDPKDIPLEELPDSELRARLKKSNASLDVSSWDTARLIEHIDNINVAVFRKKAYSDWRIRYLKVELRRRNEAFPDDADKGELVRTLKFSDWSSEFTYLDWYSG